MGVRGFESEAVERSLIEPQWVEKRSTKSRWVVILDGSSNRAAATRDITITNAFRIIKSIQWIGREGEPQNVLYFSGVGTRGDTLSALTGRGFDDIIIDAYVALSSNYLPACNNLPEDDIYILGFSRGAAAAQALTKIISEPGLLPPWRLELFPKVWKYFTCEEAQREKLKEELGNVFFKPEVAFLGAFDAVAGFS